MVKTAIRWSGLALAVGALFMGLATVSATFQPVNQAPTPLVTTLLLAASILIILALPGIYARQSEAAGWLGLLGHVLLEVGMFSIVAYAAVPLFYPEIKVGPQDNPNLGALLLGTAWLLGMVLTAIATLRARIYPRWPSILLLVAGIGLLFVFSLDEALPRIATQLGSAILGLLFASAFAWIGISTWTGGIRPAPRLSAAEKA